MSNFGRLKIFDFMVNDSLLENLTFLSSFCILHFKAYNIQGVSVIMSERKTTDRSR